MLLFSFYIVQALVLSILYNDAISNLQTAQCIDVVQYRSDKGNWYNLYSQKYTDKHNDTTYIDDNSFPSFILFTIQRNTLNSFCVICFEINALAVL